MAALRKSRKSLSLQDFVYSGIDPPDMNEWQPNRKLNFERKKLEKLKEFFDRQRALLRKNHGASIFLRNYSEGELEMFEDMINKLISSKNAEIYRMIRRQEQLESQSGTSEEEEEE